jgi:NAD(P)H-hydrate repair Nnr-like enzyme with NAD(P)H-hydrate epimerase domain
MGTSEAELIERAGTGLAEAGRRFVGPRETLVLCGPGR